MGRKARLKPAKLASKLAHIRTSLGLSQSEMIWKLGLTDELLQSHISGYELGTGEPSLIVLLRYARLAGVSMEVLVDDELDLPERLPVAPKSRKRRK
ncbi:MAG: helix-turn-helix transcriptional regulator [Blastocatellia bacterium]